MKRNWIIGGLIAAIIVTAGCGLPENCEYMERTIIKRSEDQSREKAGYLYWKERGTIVDLVDIVEDREGSSDSFYCTATAKWSDGSESPIDFTLFEDWNDEDKVKILIHVE